MSLARHMLNGDRMAALCVPEEVAEVRAALASKERVRLRRTFDQRTVDPETGEEGRIRFWRIVAPVSHPNYQSDLSIDGLKDWGIV